jgi:hypothetical protein
LGRNEGSWTGPFDSSTELAVLPDDTYRKFLLLKILRNYWRGDQGSLYDWATDEVQDVLGAPVALLDNQDMTASIWVGGALTPIAQALVDQGFYPPKPAGVLIG